MLCGTSARVIASAGRRNDKTATIRRLPNKSVGYARRMKKIRIASRCKPLNSSKAGPNCNGGGLIVIESAEPTFGRFDDVEQISD